MARWIFEALGQTGIDTKTFSEHSTTSASSSKTKTGGVPMEEDLKGRLWLKVVIYGVFRDN